MFPQHVRELFEQVQVGMPVFIVYETITVGRQGGTLYLAVFPDIYGRGTNTLAHARARLANLGLAGMLTDEALATRLQQADGLARPCFGSETPVTLDGAPVKLPLGPTERDGVNYLPLRAVSEAAGATLTWDEATHTVTVTRGEKQTAFPVDGRQAFNVLDGIFVPARALAEGLGGAISYTKEQGIALTLPVLPPVVSPLQEAPAPPQ